MGLIKALRRIKDKRGADISDLLNDAYDWVSLGKPREALYCVDEVIADGDNWDAYILKLKVLDMLGMHTEKPACQASMLDMLPHEPAVLEGRMEILSRMGMGGDMIERCEKALRATPGDVNVLASKAVLLAAAGRDAEALDCCSRVLEMEPGMDVMLDLKKKIEHAGNAPGRPPEAAHRDTCRPPGSSRRAARGRTGSPPPRTADSRRRQPHGQGAFTASVGAGPDAGFDITS